MLERTYTIILLTGNRILMGVLNIFSEPMSCIVYSEGPGYFEINQARDIILQT